MAFRESVVPPVPMLRTFVRFGPTIALAMISLFALGVSADTPAPPVPISVVVSPPETVPIAIEVVPEPAPVVVSPIPSCAWTPGARRSLVAMIRIAAAIAWTMARRWLGIARFRGRPFGAYVVDTSAPLRAHRAGEFARLTRYQACVLGVGEDCNHNDSHAAKDAEIGALLDRWVAGDVPDPCGGRSFQWFAPWWRASRRTERIDCGDTANQFRTLPRISHATVLERVSMPVDPIACR